MEGEVESMELDVKFGQHKGRWEVRLEEQCLVLRSLQTGEIYEVNRFEARDKVEVAGLVGKKLFLKVKKPIKAVFELQDEPASTPLHVWESMKAALWVSDINKASNLFIEPLVDDYAAILGELTDHFQEMVNNMGQMSLYMVDNGMAVYEYSNIAGTKLYPVIFSLDDDGNWKICKF